MMIREDQRTQMVADNLWFAPPQKNIVQCCGWYYNDLRKSPHSTGEFVEFVGSRQAQVLWYLGMVWRVQTSRCGNSNLGQNGRHPSWKLSSETFSHHFQVRFWRFTIVILEILSFGLSKWNRHFSNGISCSWALQIFSVSFLSNHS